MRKSVSFLALAAIASVLPDNAKAWDFSGNENPWKVDLVLDEPYSQELSMTFDEAEKIWSSAVFTAKGSDLRFRMRPYYGEPGSDASFTIGNSNYTATPATGWTDASTDGNDGPYNLSGLTGGTTYRIDFTEDGVADNGIFRYRVKEEHNRMYLYTMSRTEGKEVECVAEATNDNGIFTFSRDLEKGTYLFLSRNPGATTWSEMEADGGRFNPDGADIELPGNNIGFVSNKTGGAWYISHTGRYNITADWSAGTLTAVNDIYIYTSKDDWKNKIGPSTPTEYGKYTFTVELSAGEYLVLSEKSDGSSFGEIMAYNWTPGTDTEIRPNENSSFMKMESGAWYAPKAGLYAITVDWTAKTFNAFEVAVHMPLTSADFTNGKKHYFLVGERMGEWHLQPEWELREADGRLVLNNRYIYNGAFAVGMVDNYDDYIRHTFTYYCSGQDFTTSATSSAGDISGTGRVYRQGKGKTRFNPTDVFYAKFDGEDRYFEGRGTFMSEISVALNNDKLPTAISFTQGSVEEASRQRVFTLVGDNIINRNYDNTSGTGCTTMYNRAYSGWFDSWIQYDPATNRPYVDGNGEYLYHTSFTPDYLTANPVQFNLGLADGSEFAYTSGNIQFVEWSNLPNLDSDPYKEFYRAFSGMETISDSGAVKSGEGFNFKVSVECDNKETTPTADWNCYVVRDMWIGGQIKFWSGWGGNEDATNNGEHHLAVWHGPNGGPDIEENTNQDVTGYDVKSGLKAVLYKNVARRGNTNYRISDGRPVYFNRVVLWFNNTDGVSNSYIQFIQESAGPAIFAQAADNTADSSKKNYIRYHWYLNRSQNETDKDLKVISYEIRRYRLVDGKPQPAGYPEGEIVDISAYGVSVEQLYEENAGDLPFTSHLDTGIVEGRGFAPGLYQYDIYVTDETGGRKLATSNRVAIYDGDDVRPDAVAMQLVELRGEYTDHYGTWHGSAASVLGETVANGKKYLTYRTNDNDRFYIMEDIVDQEGRNIPVGVDIIDSATALDFLSNHPDKYWWTSDYYVRCLDYNSYKNTLQGYIDGGLITDSSIPEPALDVYDVIASGNGAENARIHRGEAYRFVFGDQTYYSAIVKRGGNLADATLDVVLQYDYTASDGNKMHATANAATGIDPVVPRPFNPLYRYVYERPERNLHSEYEWGKILVPVRNWLHNTTDDAIAAGDLREVYVKFDSLFDPRSFNLQVDFYRPNVNRDIYRFYDIRYHVTMDNQDESVPLHVEAVLHDEDTSDDNFPNRYRMEFKGLHPRNSVYPTVKFVKTEYVPNGATDESGQEYKPQTGNFGRMLTIDAKRTVQINTNPDGLQNVHLGKIRRDNGKWDWMYKGHEDFKDDDETLEITDSEYEDTANDTPLKPLYYLIELKNSTDEAVYDFLVPHVAGHHSGAIETDPSTGLIINDSDPLIGTYIARNFTSDETPEVVATAIYMFERPVNGNDTGSYTDFNRLEVASLKINGNETATAAVKAQSARVTAQDLVNGNAGELPDAGNLPTDNVLDMSATDSMTGYNGYIAVKGATYTNKSEENVTGVEDVLADSENGDAVYYNLQGVRVDKPTATGVYLRVQGNRTTKFVVK